MMTVFVFIVYISRTVSVAFGDDEIIKKMLYAVSEKHDLLTLK